MDDLFLMGEALIEARAAGREGEVPVGALICREGKILTRAHNRLIAMNDPTAHAEILAIREACRRIGNCRIPECDLYVTLEPCAMCLGAMVQARIRRLIYGAADPKGGAVMSIMRFPFERTNHRIEIKGGILAGECGTILKDFFRARR